MFRGKQNIKTYFEDRNLPCWKLNDQRGLLITSLEECSDVQVSWKKLEQILDIIDPGIYSLTTAPSFTNADAKRHGKVVIITEGQQATTQQPNAMGMGMYGTGIPGYGVGEIIDMKVQNALLSHQIAELKANPPASAPGPMENAIAAAITAILPVLPHVVKNLGGQANPAQPTQPAQQAAQQPKQPANPDAAAASLTASLETLNENVPDLVGTLAKLAEKSKTNPEGLVSAIGFIEAL